MIDDPRALAAQVLVRVVREGRSLTEVLPQLQANCSDARDAALLQELVYGTLRWYYRLAALLRSLLRKPLRSRDSDIHGLLLIGLYQLGWLAVPERVAVHETVQAVHRLGKDWASGLVNAVLRGYQREQAKLDAQARRDTVAAYAHPAWLIGRLQADWPGHWRAILDANNERPPMCLRVNRQRLTRQEYLEQLSAAGLGARPVAHARQGICLDRAVSVQQLPGFASGSVSVQDAAAQLAAELLAPQTGQHVLDACAAPGGKAAHLLELQPDIRLDALDIDARRLERVAETLGRLGLHARLLAADAGAVAEWWDGEPYQCILLDAPCSASGVIRRHPDIKLLRRESDIAGLIERQAQLLAALWPLLAAGGMLLYCTCSVLADENSMQVTRFLQNRADAELLPIPASWGHECSPGRQILPGENAMDGFYFACIRKRT